MSVWALSKIDKSPVLSISICSIKDITQEYLWCNWCDEFSLQVVNHLFRRKRWKATRNSISLMGKNHFHQRNGTFRKQRKYHLYIKMQFIHLYFYSLRSLFIIYVRLSLYCYYAYNLIKLINSRPKTVCDSDAPFAVKKREEMPPNMGQVLKRNWCGFTKLINNKN